jgi:hypothetical protein
MKSWVFGALAWMITTGWGGAADIAVPAHEEPRHVPRLMNAWVRVIDVEIPEGERTLFHAHTLDYPYVMLSSVTLDNEVPGRTPVKLPISRGVVGYYRASTQGAYTHRFINLGPGTFRAVGIELLQPLALGNPVTVALPARPGVETALDNERVRAYRIVIPPGATVGPLNIPGPSLRVVMTAGQLGDPAAGTGGVDVRPAQFQFRDRDAVTTVTNLGLHPLELMEFQFK